MGLGAFLELGLHWKSGQVCEGYIIYIDGYLYSVISTFDALICWLPNPCLRTREKGGWDGEGLVAAAAVASAMLGVRGRPRVVFPVVAAPTALQAKEREQMGYCICYSGV